MITQDDKLSDVIHLDYSLLPVINRFGIRLGFGDKTIKEICSEQSINTPFFLDIINTYHDQNYFPSKQLQQYPPDLIIEYLLKTHAYYKDYVLLELEADMEELIKSCTGACDNLNIIYSFYETYKQELINHLENEENVFFPYIKNLIAYKDGKLDANPISNTEFSYTNHQTEHENVLEKLYDLKNIIIKYLPPEYDTNICNTLLYKLFMFDKDLNDHERLEDRILVPLIERIETSLKQEL